MEHNNPINPGKMIKYEIELEETLSEFYEEISALTDHPTEVLLSNALSRQAEAICQKTPNIFSYGGPKKPAPPIILN